MGENTAQNEQLFQLAKEDAIATHAPKGAILGSGFLAGVLITWLPLLLYVVTFLWEALFGTVIPGSGQGKLQLALVNLGRNWGGYASVAWMYSIVLGGMGVLLAYLRAISCLTDWYMRFETRDGDIRLGMHQVLGLIGVPVMAGVILNYALGNPQIFYIMLIPLALSGLVVNFFFQMLQNAFLRRMYRPNDEQLTVLGLKVFVPRRVGANHAHIADVNIDHERNIVEIIGTFDSDATRAEVRQIAAHFLRGYDSVHVRDAEIDKAS